MESWSEIRPADRRFLNSISGLARPNYFRAAVTGTPAGGERGDLDLLGGRREARVRAPLATGADSDSGENLNPAIRIADISDSKPGERNPGFPALRHQRNSIRHQMELESVRRLEGNFGPSFRSSARVCVKIIFHLTKQGYLGIQTPNGFGISVTNSSTISHIVITIFPYLRYLRSMPFIAPFFAA